tara:strand:- start:1159 stop:1977 length:819 start_codon:yes stop_codon:yes gene_type:complete
MKSGKTEYVEAILTYAIDNGEKIVNETMGPGDMSRRRTGNVEEKLTRLQNGRPIADLFDLELNGFEFIQHPTQMLDFYSAEELKNVYYKEVEELVAHKTGATRVHVFDHTLRSGSEATRDEKLVREPVARVHNDYTEWSGPNRVRNILPDEAEMLLERRFAIVQVWRPINKPIESDPLGICDARSLEKNDLLISERRYPNRIGQTYQVAYNPRHEWYYFPRMSRDEALIFKVFDSSVDGRARYTAHSAFTDPNTPADAAPRESIEMRTMVFF